MNRFTQKHPPANPEITRQLKTWIQEILSLSPHVPISISQLQCHEPGCAPVETVIAVMLQPIQTLKIHASMEEVTQADLQQQLRPKQQQTPASETEGCRSEESLEIVRSH